MTLVKYASQWCHMSIMVWEITSTQVFLQQLVQAKIKETSKFQIIDPLWRESIGYWCIPLTKGNTESVFMSWNLHDHDWIVDIIAHE